MAQHYLGEGLVIQREGKTLEFMRRAGTKIFFEDSETGTITDFEEGNFWDQLQKREVTILDTFASPKELVYEELAEKLPVPVEVKYELDQIGRAHV